MKAILKNDWYSVRYLILILTLMSVLSSWLNSITPEEGFFSLASPLIYAGFIPPALYMIDDRSKWGRFSAGLPGRRSDYIHAKYIIVVVSVIVVMAVTIICYLIRIFNIEKNELNEQLPVLVLGFSASLIMCSVLLPVTAAFGSKAGVVTFFITITLCGVIVGYCEAMIENGELSVPDFRHSLICFGAAAIIYGLSWLTSVQIYNHKEL